MLAFTFFDIIPDLSATIVAFSAFSIDDEILNGTPRDLGINYQEIKIETKNSYISSWWIPADSETTIILLHGLRGQKADPEILKKIELFHNNGLSLIAIDFRNHGSSGEGDFTFGIDEVNDVYATKKESSKYTNTRTTKISFFLFLRRFIF